MLRNFMLALAAGAILNAALAFAPTEASAGHRRCWRCGHYGWAYSGAYYQWPAPYYVGGSRRRFYDNYVVTAHPFSRQ